MTDSLFREAVWDYYHQHCRDLPWRQIAEDGSCNRYHILVSELMLQQTQVSRVIPKFNEFIRRFPTIEALAEASLADVLALWSGLGYNRRAKYLHEAAQFLRAEPNWSTVLLTQCKGIGPHTAAAIYAYAYDRPAVFIETNIRTVYIHHYFANADKVKDEELLPIIERTLDKQQPRQWYWALMDYGTFLKKTAGNTARRSAHYTKQSAFHGSNRQLRGLVIKLLTQQAPRRMTDLTKQIDDDRLSSVFTQLQADGLIRIEDDHVGLA